MSARRGRPALPEDAKRVASLRLNLSPNEWAQIWESYRDNADPFDEAEESLAGWCRRRLLASISRTAEIDGHAGHALLDLVMGRVSKRAENTRIADSAVTRELAHLDPVRCELEEALEGALALLSLPVTAWAKPRGRRERLQVGMAAAVLHTVEQIGCPRAVAVMALRTALAARPGHAWQGAA